MFYHTCGLQNQLQLALFLTKFHEFLFVTVQKLDIKLIAVFNQNHLLSADLMYLIHYQIFLWVQIYSEWKVRICPVEVGCRGFVAKSVVSLLRELGVSGQSEENSEGSVS